MIIDGSIKTNSNLGFNQNPEIIFPNKIFGRMQAQSDLQLALNKFVSGEQVALKVIGAAGVGKSFIVRSYCKDLEKCDFYTGQFKQFKQGVPFLAFRQIFEAVLSAQKRRTEDVYTWNKEFIDRFEPYLSELNLVVPTLKDIIEFPDLNKDSFSPVETRNKINSAFFDFISFMIEKSENKIILHFDDLQWADKESLKFIEELILKKKDDLMIILSNRPIQKALSAEELNEFYSNINQTDIIRNIAIEALSKASLKDVLLSVFASSISDYDELAEISYENTQGNPYVLHEFLSSLSRSNDLRYREERWSWSIDENIDFPEKYTLPRLLIDRLENLGEKQRIIIQSSSCFGSNLNIPFISKITGISQNELQNTYIEAMKIGFIVPVSVNVEDDLSDLNNYKFSNDIIQEALHSSLVSSQKRKIHNKIADYYIEHSLIGLDSRDIYECAYHLNESVDDDDNFEKILIHAEVNLKAAEKAMSTASFSLALNYLQQAMDSNLHHNWETAYQLSAKLRIVGYQIARISGKESLANKLYAQGVEHCKGIDLSKLRFAKISIDIQFGELQTALDNGIIALKELGIKVPAKAGIPAVVKELVKTKWMLINKNPEKIFQLKEMNDKEAEFAIKLMIWLFKSAYYLNPELNAVLALKILQITLKKGTSADSSAGLMAYGIITGAGSNNFNKAYEYCNVGTQLAEKYKDDSCRRYFGQAIYKAYKYPLRDTLDLYKKAIEKGYDDGDFLGSAEPTVNESLTYFSAGFDLNLVEQKVLESAVYCEDLKMKDYHDFQFVMLCQIRILRGVSISSEDELKVKEIISSTEYQLTKTIFKLMRLQRFCIEGSWEKAFEQSEKLKKDAQSLTGIYVQAEYYFYRAMALLKNISKISGTSKIKARREVHSIIKKMNKWGESAPSNHQHKMHIISGLYEELKGKDTEAKHHFINAANLANEAKFIQNAALAYYFLAELSVRKKDEKNASHYRNKSVEFFKEWGTPLVS